MVQRYIPEIAEGDKRILIIDGKPIPYALARIPQNDDPRGNLAKGALAKGVELNERDIFIVNSISAFLKKEGIIFAGIDVIGNFLTEINITNELVGFRMRMTKGLDLTKIPKALREEYRRKVMDVVNKYPDYFKISESTISFNENGLILSDQIIPEMLLLK